ncbi:hypothetical protein KAI32_02330 [Candidatus Pacearchaeota archaeon]|nr:hypothetical protein [Candidatus Pacearchaeota archaeon]
MKLSKIKMITSNYGTRGQQTMGLPFGMIFAIFLIVIFIVVTFVGIKSFLSFGRTSSVGLFYQELQGAVDDAWRGQSSSSHFKIDLPSEIDKICFANLSATITNEEDYEFIKDFYVYEANVFLIPPGAGEGMEWKLINHLDISKIIETRNPYCVNVEDGLTIKKDFYDKLVWVE